MAQGDSVEAEDLEVQWRDIPSYYVDGAMGAAWIGGMHRVVLGEFVFNAAPGAERPATRPVASIVISPAALATLIGYLQGLPAADKNEG